jgi:hypothetical protein
MINIHEITTNFPIHPSFPEATILASTVFPQDEFFVQAVVVIDDYQDRPVALIIAVNPLNSQWHLVTLPNFDISKKTVGIYKTEEIAKQIAQNWINQYKGL